MKSHLAYVFGILLASVLFAGTANAAMVLELIDVEPGDEVGQTGDDPCVIGENSCGNNQPAGLDWTLIPVSNGDWKLMSPVYTVEQIVGIVGSDKMSVGIDVNVNAKSTETLNSFEVWVGGSLLFEYTGGADLADANDLANGTGFSDWLLTGIDLEGFDNTDEIKFVARMSNTGAGKEQFFLTSAGLNPIPIPAAAWLFGSALLGLVGIGRRKAALKAAV